MPRMNRVSPLSHNVSAISPVNGSPISYRRDIDGLRAVAILSVILFHAFPTAVAGGFVGVDVFFVISGFLISGIIFAGLQDGRFSLRMFYVRRICRLFPALLVVLAFCLIAAWFILLPDEYRQLGKHVGGAAIYMSNFVLRREAGYFDTNADLKPLLHLWSLAIEEQFYIAWPFVAVFAYRRRIDLFNLIAFLLAVSLVYNLIRITRNPVATFFLPGTRAWELLAGVLLASVGHFGWTGIGQRVVAAVPWRISADWRATAGLAAIVLPAALLDKTSLFPGWWATVPTVGTVLLISAGPSAWINRTVLAHPAMVFIGLISYPLYLWHWPLLSLAHFADGGRSPSPLLRAMLLGLSLLLAILTYRLVERPIRFGAAPRLPTAATLAFLCLGLGVAGQGINEGWVRPYASRFGVDKVVLAAGEWAYPSPDMERLIFDGRTIWRKTGSGGSVLFLGDSNVEQYWPRVRALLAGAPGSYKTAQFLTGGGCPPIPAVEEPRHPHCRGLTEAAQDFVEKNGVDTVVIAAQWWGYFQSTAYRIDGLPLSGPQAADRAMASFSRFIRHFVATGRRVYVVLNIPISPELDPKSLVDRSTFMSFSIKAGGVRLTQLEDSFGETSRRLRAAAMQAGATVIDPLNYLCDQQGLCPATTVDGDPIYKDSSHLRPTYVRSHVKYLDAIMSRDKV